jgi:S-layer like family, C-terminal region
LGFINELTLDNFGGMLADIPLNLLAGALWATPVWFILRHVPSRRLWNTADYSAQPWRKPPAPYILLSANKSDPDANGFHVSRTGLGQVQALSVIAPSLASAYKDSISHGAVQFASNLDTNSTILRGSDLLLIGGPKTNPLTKAVLDLAKLPVKFETVAKDGAHGGSVDVISYKNPATGKMQKLVTNGDEAYALIAQFENPFSHDSSNTITLLAGSSTYGTELAALAFAAKGNLRKMVPLFKKRKGFVAIAQGDLAGRSDSDRWVGSQKIIFIEHFEFSRKKR